MTSARFLVLQLRPEDSVTHSEHAAILAYAGLSEHRVHRIRVDQTSLPEIDLSAYAGIIVGGSPFDLTTPSGEKSKIQQRVEADFQRLLAQVVPSDFPFLGACSGCGLLSRYLGAPITRAYGESIACVSVTLTDEGKRDSLLAGYPDRIDVLTGHKEACDGTPDGAVLLMTGNECPVQMFRVGQNVYATQFHPEADFEGFELRVRTYQDNGYFPPGEASAVLNRIRDADTSYSQQILQRFVNRYS